MLLGEVVAAAGDTGLRAKLVLGSVPDEFKFGFSYSCLLQLIYPGTSGLVSGFSSYDYSFAFDSYDYAYSFAFDSGLIQCSYYLVEDWIPDSPY